MDEIYKLILGQEWEKLCDLLDKRRIQKIIEDNLEEIVINGSNLPSRIEYGKKGLSLVLTIPGFLADVSKPCYIKMDLEKVLRPYFDAPISEVHIKIPENSKFSKIIVENGQRLRLFLISNNSTLLEIEDFKYISIGGFCYNEKKLEVENLEMLGRGIEFSNSLQIRAFSADSQYYIKVTYDGLNKKTSIDLIERKETF